MKRLLIAAILFGGLSLILGGCGDDDSAATKTAPAATGSVQVAAGAAIKATESAKLGAILTDATGFTLYTFDTDQEGTGKSACTGGCAGTWPPAITTAAKLEKVAGLSGELGTITRDDGSKQITYAGHPLYRFSGDQKAGDTNGDGVGGVWHAAKAAPAPAASATATSGSYGY
jgi:predicted lipoprotein with Yx(FWY)xxD motif